jgi:hypothetical protein
VHPDGKINAVHGRGLWQDLAMIIDLLLTISFYATMVRMLAALQIDVEDDYLPYLREFPLPA